MKLGPSILLTALIVAVSSVEATEPLPRSISASRQIIVYGTDVALRGAVADLAERSKARLLGVLRKRDDWKTPILVNLQFPLANLPETPASELHLSQTGFGLKLQLNLTIAADLHAPSVQRELLRALLLELIYRNHSDLAPGTIYTAVPDWLLEGLIGLESREQEVLAEALESGVASKNLMSLEQVLRQKPNQLDSAAHLLYRAHALVLLQFLVSEGGGPARLATYIENLARASNDPFSDLKGSFPLLVSAPDLRAKWESAVKTFASTGSYRLLTFAETWRRLEELLGSGLPDPKDKTKTVPLEKLATVKPVSTQVAALRRLTQDLSVLATTANPVLRPVVLEYQQIAHRLAVGKRSGVQRRLARLQKTRVAMGGRMNEIDDYMNWFEATQMTTKSGVFTNYLKAAEAPSDPPRRRRDALSVYLDAIEAQFRD
jgi:hypothetical protein